MSAKAPRGARIDTLAVRVPGRDTGAGRRIAAAVTERLATHPPAWGRGAFGQVDLVVRAPRDGGEAALSDAIARAILAATHRR